MSRFHPLARTHLHRKNLTVSGMPKENFDNTEIKRLHCNVNYYVDSPYIFYPNEVNPLLFSHFVDYLNFEKKTKRLASPKLTLDPSQILFIASSECIDLLIRTFCEPGKDIICVVNPTFPYYAFAASNNHVDCFEVPLVGEYFDHLQIERMVEKKPKLIFIPFPNNPVGTLIPKKQILELLNTFEGLLVLDEAYIEFADEPSCVDWIHQFPNLVILRSFSKVWGMAGIRCGATIANSLIITTLNQVRPPCSFPSHTQQLVLQMLQTPETVMKVKMNAEEERRFLKDELNKIGIVKKVFPSHTNFILVELEDSSIVFNELNQRRILVKNMHPLIPNALRISLGTRSDHLVLLQVLSEVNATIKNTNN